MLKKCRTVGATIQKNFNSFSVKTLWEDDLTPSLERAICEEVSKIEMDLGIHRSKKRDKKVQEEGQFQ